MKNQLPLLVLLACPALLRAQDVAPASPPDHYVQTVTMWEGMVMGGPIFLGLHLLALIGFVAGIICSVRYPRSVRAALWCISPFIFGATAVWIGTIGVSAVAAAPLFEDSISGRLRLLHRPFLGGLGLSTIAFVILFICRVRSVRQQA